MKDLTNKKFNKLLVTSFSHRNGKHYYWNIKCDCGNTKTMRADTIKRSDVGGCGCGVAESQRLNPHNVKHRLSHTPFSGTYYAMRSRCDKKTNNMYYNYGAKGVTYEWKTFKHFYDDMYASYQEALDKANGQRITLDRIDNSKGYSTDNCRWSSYKEQGRNRTNNVMFTHTGKTKCLSEWAEENGMQTSTLWARIRNYGWTFEKAISTPVR